jgi:hypothetical protein
MSPTSTTGWTASKLGISGPYRADPGDALDHTYLDETPRQLDLSSLLSEARAAADIKRCEHYRLRILRHTGGITWPNRPSPPRTRTRAPHSNALSRIGTSIPVCAAATI